MWHKTCLLIEPNIFTPSIIKSNKEINLCSIINVSLFHLIWECSRHSMNIHHLILLKIPFLSPHVTGIRVLGFPREKSKGNPRKISRQILLSLYSSTGEIAPRKGRFFELAQGLALFGYFHKLGQSRLVRRWAFLAGATCMGSCNYLER